MGASVSRRNPAYKTPPNPLEIVLTPLQMPHFDSPVKRAKSAFPGNAKHKHDYSTYLIHISVPEVGECREEAVAVCRYLHRFAVLKAP